VSKVLVTSLGTEDEESANDAVGEDGQGREVPDEGVADEVDLTVILDPAEGSRRD
jgi:hypothetical protein